MNRLFLARHFDSLQKHLRRLDRPVPEHPRQRVNEHIQTYSLVSLLAGVPWSQAYFPVEVFSSERPDFVLIFNGREIGLEHTEAIHQNQAKERALRADGHGPDVYFPIKVSVHDPVLSSKKILEKINADDPGDGWLGDEVERNWAEAMQFLIEKKVKSANKVGYNKYPDNRLLIYDNWTAPALNHTRGLKYLRKRLEDEALWSVFGHIYIVDEQSTIQITHNETLLIRSPRHSL